MDIEYFKSLDSAVEKAPSEMKGLIQVLNVSGSILHILDGRYLRTMKYAFVHPNNPRIQNLIKSRKIQDIPFRLEAASRKKKEIKTAEVLPPVVNKLSELENLKNLFENPSNKEPSE